MNILKQIVASTKIRVEREKKINRRPFLFEKSLQCSDFSYICEIKKASPSKGVIAEEFPYLTIAKEYEAAGADAISVLTEPQYFLGSNQYLEEIRKVTKIPILRKDFVIDPFQIEQTSYLGADAILLICSILTEQQLTEYIKLADSFGLSCLVEVHDEREINMALGAGARVIGINNRNLKTFQVDIQTTIQLRKMIPKDILLISESGIGTREDIKVLEQEEVNGVLIGETLMRAENKKQMLASLKGKQYE